MFGLHSTTNVLAFSKKDEKYLGNLVLREIALFAGAHQRSSKWFLVIAITGKLALPFIARYVVYGVFTLDWDSAIYTAIETLALSIFLL